ncbi:MAG: uroporphyrinogen-III decarboxylase-like protein [Kiritimatiellae bacterium]|nr:uroporphyrinogen-III decarboxylase-like protein [Kiritimatiellia bacterium]
MKRIRRDVHFGEFLKVLRRKERPAYLPFYEHVASPGFIAACTNTAFDRMPANDPQRWAIYLDFWLSLGFDCVPMEIPLNCPLPDSGQGSARSHESEAQVVFRSMEDFEKYPWPNEAEPINYKPFEIVGGLLPDGVKIVGGVGAGPYEWASRMLGTVGMAYAMVDCPELVENVFKKIGSLHISAVRGLSEMDCVGALRQGDDLGFKTSTFLSPSQLRQYVFPIYRNMVDIAHSHGKPFILHSCGNLAEVYEDIISCGFDAKHSFEDVILPVHEFKRRYGGRITALGGLDVDMICRGTEREVRAYARRMIELCFADGYWALGTGNSLTDYMPVENYIWVLEEGLRGQA